MKLSRLLHIISRIGVEKWVYTLFVFLCWKNVPAQEIDMFEPDSIKKKLPALKIDEAPKIDGQLLEPVWQNAETAQPFTQIDPYQGAAPNHDTYLKVLYDNTNLYFGVFCEDTLGRRSLRATDFKRDFNFQTHDLITLCLDAFNDERNAMSFAVNPYGVQRDYLSFDAQYYDIEWDAYWSTRTSRTDSGWVAEIAIPWKTLRYPKAEQEIQNWGFQLYRNRRMTYEISAFSEFPRAFGAARMDYAGQLNNLQPPSPTANIRIQPYLLAQQNRIRTSSAEVRDAEPKIGGDLKWAINSNDVLDLTINTDFAQADVDRLINNTTRFSVFFPERRQFFLENASLFSLNIGPGGGPAGGTMRIQPFFSRRIGLDDAGRPIPLDVGARYVHRSSQSNYGAMLLRQRGVGEIDASNYFISRYSTNFGKQNRVGALVTLKNQSGETQVTGTTDLFIRLSESQSLNTMFSTSATTTGAPSGISAVAQYYYSTNRWKAWWTQSVVSRNYRPEVGFVSRSNVIGTTPGVIRYIRGDGLPFKKWLRALEPSVFAEYYHEVSSGNLIERQLGSYPIYLNLQNGGFLGYGFTQIFQRLDTPFSPLGVTINPGSFNYQRHIFFGSTDASKKIYAKFNYVTGSYFDGRLRDQNYQLFFVPIPHISIGGRYNRLTFENVGGTDQRVDLYGFEGRFALNPRLQFTFIYQMNSQGDSQNINARISWEYRPLSFVYFVYNLREFDDHLEVRQLQEQAIAKLSFLKQF